MKLLDVKARIIERLGGELPYDWGWEPEPREPDYYDEDGNPGYDISKALVEFQSERNEFLTLMAKLPREQPQINWLEDELMPRLQSAAHWWFEDWSWTDQPKED